MDKTLIFKRIGGNVRLDHEVINFRIDNFSRRKLEAPLTKIPPDARQDIVFTLYNFWHYTPKELAELMGTSRATIYRDICNGEFLIQRDKKRQYRVERIVDYIIYNMGFLPL